MHGSWPVPALQVRLDVALNTVHNGKIECIKIRSAVATCSYPRFMKPNQFMSTLLMSINETGDWNAVTG
jgi:hypothetical protein